MRKRMMMILWCVLAAVFLFYGILILRARSGTGFFLILLGCGVVSAGFAVATAFRVWEKLPVGVRRTGLILFGVGLLLFTVTEAFIISGFFEKEEKNLDYILVLGAQVYETGPSTVLKYRLDRAVRYLTENPQTKCIVSGGQGSNEPYPEAVGMAEYLMGQGISEDRILLEQESKTTQQNIEYSRKLMEEGASVGLVTNNFHMYRALRIAKKQGLTDVCGIVADSTNLYLPSNLFREFFAMVKWVVFP